MTESCIATCSRRPLPLRARSKSALTMLKAMSMPVPVSPIAQAAACASNAHRTTGGLRDRVERQPLLERAAVAKALDLGIDDRRVDAADDIIAEPQALNGAGRE